MTPIVSASWLRSYDEKSAEPLRIVDVRWYLRDRSGRDEYARGHIPGAVFVDLEHEITAPAGPGRHPIPTKDQLTLAMRRAGVSASTHVVAYDDADGSIAARLWWLLRKHGHARVSVLDGGLKAWVAAGGPLATEVPSVEEGTFTALPLPPSAIVDKGAVDRARRDPTTRILDARARERYRGDIEPVDARPGHIPGAKSAPFSENVDGGTFRAPTELREHYARLGAIDAKELIVYCGSGVTACHDLLALELAGITGAKLYEGSWSDWARDEILPAALGDD